MNPKEMTDGEVLDLIYQIADSDDTAESKLAMIAKLLEDCKTY